MTAEGRDPEPGVTALRKRGLRSGRGGGTAQDTFNEEELNGRMNDTRFQDLLKKDLLKRQSSPGMRIDGRTELKAQK